MENIVTTTMRCPDCCGGNLSWLQKFTVEDIFPEGLPKEYVEEVIIGKCIYCEGEAFGMCYHVPENIV